MACPFRFSQHGARPDLLILRHAESGDSFDGRPLIQKAPVGIENLDSPRFPIRDVNFASGVNHHIVGQFELARTCSSSAPLQQIFPVMRELHHADAGVPVGYVEISVGSGNPTSVDRLKVLWPAPATPFCPS